MSSRKKDKKDKKGEGMVQKEIFRLELAFFIFILLNILSRRYDSDVFDIISIGPWIYIIVVIFRRLLSK